MKFTLLIDLDVLYNSSFKSETIGRSVRSPIHAERDPEGGAPFRHLQTIPTICGRTPLRIELGPKDF
jgi:hypothetical protein